jgi:hypothetical protein
MHHRSNHGNLLHGEDHKLVAVDSVESNSDYIRLGQPLAVILSICIRVDKYIAISSVIGTAAISVGDGG